MEFWDLISPTYVDRLFLLCFDWPILVLPALCVLAILFCIGMPGVRNAYKHSRLTLVFDVITIVGTFGYFAFNFILWRNPSFFLVLAGSSNLESVQQLDVHKAQALFRFIYRWAGLGFLLLVLNIALVLRLYVCGRLAAPTNYTWFDIYPAGNTGARQACPADVQIDSNGNLVPSGSTTLPAVKVWIDQGKLLVVLELPPPTPPPTSRTGALPPPTPPPIVPLAHLKATLDGVPLQEGQEVSVFGSAKLGVTGSTQTEYVITGRS